MVGLLSYCVTVYRMSTVISHGLVDIQRLLNMNCIAVN
uniref:Uncharacterized protein n=1 Tax=Anguilla anguilla TaxID=7936 RepID=A0A0E9UAT3_ANGAN